ncbi:metallophosphoesterase family protein [Rhizosphaericola mali]|uniref:Phosphoesterase n=1 Tax=Rhizosphaericola mali TaxID=2545455 RepID=A0A5P2G6L3_9BACT|nr:metallophosphoesterase family protein [Rhizosphaericola mali]QES90348.1 metallophosphoesterase family protein [Rhizosphaericola mali]
MTKIGLLSDTHGYLPEQVFEHFKDCDEIWHAGDFGGNNVAEKLAAFKPLRGVYGNIDGKDIRQEFPEINIFEIENLKVCMKHIGGYPGKYAPGVKAMLQVTKPGLFISGHSHILKVVYDQALQCMHFNPGAAGKQGWHQVQTLMKFVIDGDKLKDCKVIELGKK